MGFQELTFVSTYHDQSEVMVDVDVETKEIVGMYTYEDSIPELWEDTEQEFMVKWTKGKNPLFHHVSTDLECAFEALVKEGFICCGLETEEEELFVSDTLVKHGLTNYIESY